MSPEPRRQRNKTVQEDWPASLPSAQSELLNRLMEDLESLYSILTSSLHEAFELRREGSLNHARERVEISSDAFFRLSAHILVLLQNMEAHSRRFGTEPNTAPLNPRFFRGDIAQGYARRNTLLGNILLSKRLRYSKKSQFLGKTVTSLQEEFRRTASRITDENTELREGREQRDWENGGVPDDATEREARPRRIWGALETVSSSPRRKLAVAWSTFGVLVVPLSGLVAVGVSERNAILSLVTLFLPVQLALSIAFSRASKPSASAGVSPWGTLEILHYDINTCLRESNIMLKSFLCVLSQAEFGRFRRRFESAAEFRRHIKFDKSPERWIVPGGYDDLLTAEDIAGTRRAS